MSMNVRNLEFEVSSNAALSANAANKKVDKVEYKTTFSVSSFSSGKRFHLVLILLSSYGYFSTF